MFTLLRNRTSRQPAGELAALHERVAVAELRQAASVLLDGYRSGHAVSAHQLAVDLHDVLAAHGVGLARRSRS